MIKKALATLALAIIAAFAVPAAAHAAYVPAGNITVSGTVTASGTVTVNFANGSFVAGGTVTFTVSGSGTATLAAYKAATVSLEKTADADGSVAVDVTLPANATGTYTVTAVDSAGNIGTAALTVVPADADGGSGLPDTGAEVPVLALWTAGGALVLGAALIAVMTMVRRQRLSQD